MHITQVLICISPEYLGEYLGCFGIFTIWYCSLPRYYASTGPLSSDKDHKTPGSTSGNSLAPTFSPHSPLFLKSTKGVWQFSFHFLINPTVACNWLVVTGTWILFFHSVGYPVSRNVWFRMEHTIEIDDLEVPPFQETLMFLGMSSSQLTNSNLVQMDWNTNQVLFPIVSHMCFAVKSQEIQNLPLDLAEYP